MLLSLHCIDAPIGLLLKGSSQTLDFCHYIVALDNYLYQLIIMTLLKLC